MSDFSNDIKAFIQGDSKKEEKKKQKVIIKKNKDDNILFRINSDDKIKLKNHARKLNISLSSVIQIALSDYMRKNNLN